MDRQRVETLREGMAEDAGLSPVVLATLRERAGEWVAEGSRTRSLAAVVARRGIVAFNESFGPLTHEPDSPRLARDSLFAAGSVTKPVTATLALILVEDGLLGLTRKVTRYVPELRGDGVDQVQVHHLMTHTSGFTEETEDAIQQRVVAGQDLPPMESTQHPWTHRYLHALCPCALTRPPGVQMSYSQVNFGLLGEIVRRVSGQPLDVFARERLFAPLGMKDSSYRFDEAHGHRFVKRGPGVPFGEGLWDSEKTLDIPFGHAGLNSTAQDLAIFCQMFLNKGRYGDARVLGRRAVEEMTRNQVPGIGTDTFGSWHDEASWGLGWGVQGSERWRYYNGALTLPGSYHHGGAGGCFMLVDPAKELIMVYCSVCPDIDVDTGEHRWDCDKFQDFGDGGRAA